jgi:hypothetical protein
MDNRGVIHASKLHSEPHLLSHGGEPREAGAPRKPKAIVVVGGGLTSCDIAIAEAKRNPAAIVHIVHRKKTLWTAPFDLPTRYFSGRSRNKVLCDFSQLDDAAKREDFLLRERPGATVTPKSHTRICELEKAGRVVVHASSEIGECASHDNGTFSLTLKSGKEIHGVDRVWLATGTSAGVTESNTLLHSLHAQRPVEISPRMRLPYVKSDLPWDEETPFFVTGVAASLQIGPEASNMRGARLAAARIADSNLFRQSVQWKQEETKRGQGESTAAVAAASAEATKENNITTHAHPTKVSNAHRAKGSRRCKRRNNNSATIMQ